MGWLGRKDPLQIVTFRSYGTSSHLYARGRALEDEAIDLGRKGTLQLLLSTWKRFETDEVRNTPLHLTLGGASYALQTDKDGYYLLDQAHPGLNALADAEGWVPYTVSYVPEGLSRPILRENRFGGELLIPPQTARFGIITDIDDTILHTGVTSYLKWQVIANTVFKRAESRIPLHGAPELYHKLHGGVGGQCGNPVFYVSHSPWNLYRYLDYFLTRNAFPKGPILLRSMASFLSRRRGGAPHKQHEIENILKTYPDLPFVLIGDSGERDADIYLELAGRFPGRVAAIYLRSVRHRGRMRRVRELISREKEVPVLLVQESEEVLHHARGLGLV
ncbi:App1 family protein [Robiginitalea sediminis]|uniref:App1 family protein n=1 Tax=Robiginitalea sediminis TaxID=1982593 RepID=UPI000B4A9D1B|nr:phosphatase domain-containing protein [Robiginitalea sediminis]